ncbi:MAG: cadherin-like domain-containing protein [Marmoricola sp.]|nr:cadherin-like domain-containing protein [Marmoricola sp.]
MTRRTRAWVAAGTATLLAGLGLGFAAPANAESQPCAGMSAPQVTNPGNSAPVPHDDTTTALAGGSRVVRVLANDTDPDGDPLYVVSVSQPGRGDVCVDSDGAIEYFADVSSTGYTDHVTYGVTDGDLYRTATLTVTVKGIKPMRATLVHRKKGKHKAVVSFTNPNDRAMTVLAGSPKKKNPQITRTIGVGQTISFKTKYKKIVFFALARDLDGAPIFVDIGVLNTKTGAQSISSGDVAFFRKHVNLRPLQRQWVHRHR